MSFQHIPKELVNIILEFDGNIKYKNNQYVNILHKYDTRYDLVDIIIKNKLMLINKNMEINDSGFYCDIPFNKEYTMGIIYDYSWYFGDKLSVCYYDWRDIENIVQLRIVL